jgi:hypothetical protein
MASSVAGKDQFWRNGMSLECDDCERTVSRRTSMAKNRHKCAHGNCQCQVSEDEKFCSEYCREAGEEIVEIGCGCEHKPCHDTL